MKKQNHTVIFKYLLYLYTLNIKSVIHSLDFASFQYVHLQKLKSSHRNGDDEAPCAAAVFLLSNNNLVKTANQVGLTSFR